MPRRCHTERFLWKAQTPQLQQVSCIATQWLVKLKLKLEVSIWGPSSPCYHCPNGCNTNLQRFLELKLETAAASNFHCVSKENVHSLSLQIRGGFHNTGVQNILYVDCSILRSKGQDSEQKIEENLENKLNTSPGGIFCPKILPGDNCLRDVLFFSSSCTLHCVTNEGWSIAHLRPREKEVKGPFCASKLWKHQSMELHVLKLVPWKIPI